MSEEMIAVRSEAVEWLKKHYPALCEKSGLCERIAGRLYTRTTLAAQPAACARPAPDIRPAAVRMLADERRKALEEAEALLRQRLDAAKHTHAISEGPYSEGMRDAYDVAVLDIQSMIDRKEPT